MNKTLYANEITIYEKKIWKVFILIFFYLTKPKFGFILQLLFLPSTDQNKIMLQKANLFFYLFKNIEKILTILRP